LKISTRIHRPSYAAKFCWARAPVKTPSVQHSLSSSDRFGDYATGR